MGGEGCFGKRYLPRTPVGRICNSSLTAGRWDRIYCSAVRDGESGPPPKGVSPHIVANRLIVQ